MKFLIGAVSLCVAGLSQAGQDTKTCNQGGNETTCEIDVPMTVSGGGTACTANPPGVLTRRHTNPSTHITMTWRVAPGFRFDSSQVGVDIADVNGHFDRIGADGNRKYKWKAKNPPGTTNMFANYDVHVVHVPGHGRPEVPCTQVDPLIINRD